MMLVTAISAEPCKGPVCSYTFDITSKSSHVWEGFRVGIENGSLITIPNLSNPQRPPTPVASEDVVTLDGHWRDVIHINGRFPGPTIDVMKGVKVGYFCL